VLHIFIGFDTREEVAFDTLAHSIRRQSSIPVSILPIKQQEVREKGLYSRDRGPTESTEFSLTRFLVPALSKYRGWSMFIDCDMLCRTDVAGIAREIARQPDKALLVCKHDYTPSPKRKFLNQVQTAYPRKNWSSVMLMNNALCAALTPEYVNRASGLDLHRFNWLGDDDAIGELDLEWNWLVGEYAYNPKARIAHFTRGGPWFPEYVESDYADEWFRERDAMSSRGALQKIARPGTPR
jgi:hypothetical protein